MCEYSVFSAAGEKLGYTQSTVSSQIKQLEKELGATLFDRFYHRIVLTQEGSRVLRYARDVLSAQEKLMNDLHHAENVSGELHLAMSSSVCARYFDDDFIDFQRRFPEVRLTITEADTERMFSMLRKNEADLVFTLDTHIYDPEFEICAEQEEQVHFVASASNPLTAAESLRLCDIVHEPFVLTEKGMSYRRILDERLAVGAKLPNEYELADRFGVSRGTIREAVKLLVSRGVLRVKHGSGTYVASLMPLKADPLGLDAIEDRIQLALDLTDVRLMLEPAIAELAARNRTEEEAQRLTEYCDAVRRRIQAGEDYLIEDMRFHWYLAKCSHNMVVEPLMPIIDAAVVSIANITRKELLTATVDTHQEILNGVLDQDPQAARAAVALHLEMNRIVIKHAKERSEKTK